MIVSFYRFDTKNTIVVAGQNIDIELVSSLEDKARGLSNREELKENKGMLFVYDNYLIPGFWMKEMRFPIDIIWIKDDMIMGYEKNLKLSVDNQPLQIYQPKTFVNYVLEVNAGFVDRYGVRVGDKITFFNKK
jgi:hypothetical protein